MEEIKSPVCLCSACRKSFVGGDVRVADGCPNCGSSKVVFIFSPSSLVDAHENSTAFEALCNLSANSNDVEEVADIMGIEGGCTQHRKDSTNVDALAEWMSRNGL